jgi:hypothetical protein
MMGMGQIVRTHSSYSLFFLDFRDYPIFGVHNDSTHSDITVLLAKKLGAVDD